MLKLAFGFILFCITALCFTFFSFEENRKHRFIFFIALVFSSFCFTALIVHMVKPEFFSSVNFGIYLLFLSTYIFKAIFSAAFLIYIILFILYAFAFLFFENVTCLEPKDTNINFAKFLTATIFLIYYIMT